MDYFKLITNYRSVNNKKYTNLKNKIKNNVSGRICHHKVSILNSIIELFDIERYLEIGTHNGASMSYIVAQNKSIKCIGVDLFGEDDSDSNFDATIQHGKYIRDGLKVDRTFKNISSSNIGNSKIKLIKGNSQKKETIDKVLKELDGMLIDLLFIDGDHTFNGVSNDFKNYEKLVKPGGFIVLDDYNPAWPGIVDFVDNYLDRDKFGVLGVFDNNELIMIKK